MTGQVGEPLSHGSGFTELSWKLTISLVWEPGALTFPSRGTPMTFSRGWNPQEAELSPFLLSHVGVLAAREPWSGRPERRGNPGP